MTPTTAASAAVFAESERLFPGGVNSPVRAFRAVGGTPVVLRDGRGSTVTDLDGRSYLDYIGSWGALILGHAAPEVVEAVREAAARGTSFGMPTPYEVELGRLIQNAVPSMERLRLVTSGTEAAMSALRVARAYTRRNRLVKFAGCYHGHADALLAQAGSGVATFGLPSSAGVPPAAVADTIVLPYNDLDAVERTFAADPEGIAAVIVEPVAANMGVIRPAPGFLERLRGITADHGSLLIFDEVITGFRVSPGGAQQRYGVRPDLTCLGKIIGGGLPLAAYGGRSEILDLLAPHGPVYQAGTLAGNPVAVAAGTATLMRLADRDLYQVLEQRGAALERGLVESIEDTGVAACVVREASMLTVFFTPSPPENLAQASTADLHRFRRFFHGMRQRGVLLPPSQFEAWFISAAHTDDDVLQSVHAAAAALAEAA